MKVRIQGNSLRFRLKQFEVTFFTENKWLKEEVQFGEEVADTLQFILRASTSSRLSLTYEKGKVTVLIPQTKAAEWASTDLVGIGETVETKKGKRITLLIEKDFKCLEGSEEDNKGSFPNPREAC